MIFPSFPTFAFSNLVSPLFVQMMYWNPWAYNPINTALVHVTFIFLIISCPGLPSLSSCPLADPGPRTLLSELREIQIDTKYNGHCGFHNKLPDGVIKGCLAWMTASAIFLNWGQAHAKPERAGWECLQCHSVKCYQYMTFLIFYDYDGTGQIVAENVFCEAQRVILFKVLHKHCIKSDLCTQHTHIEAVHDGNFS